MEDEFYPENISDVSVSAILALTVFMDSLNDMNIKNIKVVPFLPIRYKNKEDAYEKKYQLKLKQLKVDENYQQTTYEMFGPSGSTLVIDCLTDNLNRSISELRAVANKCHVKMGAQGSVTFNYDHLCIVGFKGLTEEETMDALIEKGADFVDMELDGDMIIVYGNPQNLYQIKDAITSKLPNVEFDIDEISYIAKEKISLSEDDKVIFDRILTLLDDVEDVQNVYHNVEI